MASHLHVRFAVTHPAPLLLLLSLLRKLFCLTGGLFDDDDELPAPQLPPVSLAVGMGVALGAPTGSTALLQGNPPSPAADLPDSHKQLALVPEAKGTASPPQAKDVEAEAAAPKGQLGSMPHAEFMGALEWLADFIPKAPPQVLFRAFNRSAPLTPVEFRELQEELQRMKRGSRSPSRPTSRDNGAAGLEPSPSGRLPEGYGYRDGYGPSARAASRERYPPHPSYPEDRPRYSPGEGMGRYPEDRSPPYRNRPHVSPGRLPPRGGGPSYDYPPEFDDRERRFGGQRLFPDRYADPRFPDRGYDAPPRPMDRFDDRLDGRPYADDRPPMERPPFERNRFDRPPYEQDRPPMDWDRFDRPPMDRARPPMDRGYPERGRPPPFDRPGPAGDRFPPPEERYGRGGLDGGGYERRGGGQQPVQDLRHIIRAKVRSRNCAIHGTSGYAAISARL